MSVFSSEQPPAHEEGLFGAADISEGTFHPVPVVAIGGVDIASGAAGPTDTLMVVDGVEITWGRDAVLDQPTPATGTLTLFDATATWATATDRRGQLVTLRWAGAESDGTYWERTYFRGRIGLPTVAPRSVVHPITGARIDGSVVTLPLQSVMVDLGNIVSTSNWPAETMGARFDRVILAAQNAGLLTGGGSMRAFWRDPMVPAVAPKDQVSLLNHLIDLYTSSGADRMVYSPDTDAVSYVPRKDFPSDRGLAGLWWDASVAGLSRAGQGAYLRSYALAPAGATAGSSLASYLDAATLEYDPSDGITAPARISRVAIAHPDAGATPAYSTRNVELAVTGVSEGVAGIRSARVDSLVSWNSYADVALSDLEVMVRREGSQWLPRPLLLTTRKTGGFETSEAARVLVTGRENNSMVFLQRSWLPNYGIRPIFGVMGGTIAYRREGWEIEIIVSPVTTTAKQHAITWEEIDDGTTSYELRWYDGDNPRGLHESLTYEDMAYCATGLSVNVIPADTGWDLTQ